MRIAALQIDSFGIFRDMSLTSLPPGLVLIQGDNEAGKSTLLWFMRGMLFGFPDGRSKDPRYLFADGGIHGGRLDVVTDNGGEYTVSRRGIRGGGEVAITDMEDVNCGEETLRHFLGNTTAQLYRNVYAFSLAELHSIESLQAEGVKGAIYGATAGTALLALPQALKKLDDRLEDTFRPRGQKQQINRRLAELDSITESLRDAFKGIGQYDEACTQLAQTQARIVEIQNALSGLRSAAVMVDAHLQLWPEWISLQECAAELQDLPLVVESFPENGLGRLDAAQERLQAKQEQLQELEEKRTVLRRDTDDLGIDPQIIAQGEAITVLTERRTQYIATCDDLPLQMQKRGGVNAEIEDHLRRLGPGWTEEKVLQTDCSVVAREAIRAHEQSLADARAEVARAEQDLATRQKAYEVAVRDEKAAHQKVEQFADVEPVDETLVRDLQTGRALFREAAHDLPRVEVDLRRAQARVKEGIREIDPHWSIDNVSNFDVSIAAQRKVAEFARRFEEARKALGTADSRRAAKDELLRGSQEQLAALVSESERLPDSTGREAVSQKKAAMISLKTASQERAQCASETRNAQSRLEDKCQELARLQAQPVLSMAPPWWLSLMIMLIAATALVIGLAMGKLLEGAIVAAVIAAVGALSFVWSRVVKTKSADARRAHAAMIDQVERDVGVLRADIEKLHGVIAELDETITEHARPLSLSASVTPEEIREAEQALERDLDALKRHEQLQRELRKQAEEVQRRKHEWSDAEEALKKRLEALETVNREWEAHLSGLGLVPESTVETIQLVFTKVVALRDQVAELDNKAERIERMTTSRESYLALARRVPSLVPHCDGAAADLLSAVDRFVEDVQRQQEGLQELELAQRALADERRRVSATTEALRKAEEALGVVKQHQGAAQRAWQECLTRHGLADDLSPPTALDALRLVENAIDRLTGRGQLDEAIAQLEDNATAYQQDAGTVFEALQRRVPEPVDLPARIEQLGRELGLNKENAARRREMERQMESLSGQIESARRLIDETTQHITSLLEEGNAVDESAFRERHQWHVRRNELCATIAQAESTIRKISGQMDLDTLKAKLAKTSRERLEVRRQEIDLGIADADSQLAALRDAKAELTNKIEGLKTADTVAQLRTQEERVLAEIHPLALQWTRHALARWLLLQARKKFEEEQQPKVVRDAAEFFSAMTRGRYTKIIAPVGADTIEVLTAAGERRKPEELSRGTTEQLYLALRFGYIRLRAADHERLPVVMDDILVNFDPQRATEAAATVLKLAGEHQVLFFTCHPETVAQFRQHDVSLPVYQLQEGAMSAVMP